MMTPRTRSESTDPVRVHGPSPRTRSEGALRPSDDAGPSPPAGPLHLVLRVVRVDSSAGRAALSSLCPRKEGAGGRRGRAGGRRDDKGFRLVTAGSPQSGNCLVTDILLLRRHSVERLSLSMRVALKTCSVIYIYIYIYIYICAKIVSCMFSDPVQRTKDTGTRT